MKRLGAFFCLAAIITGAVFAQGADSIAQSLVNDGISYAQKKDYDRALKAFDRAISRDPSLSAAIYNRGIVYYRQGDMASAVSDFKKACSMGNSGSCALLKQMEVSERQKYSAVSDLLAQAAKLDADGKTDDALKLLNDAILKEPESPQVYYMQAELYYRAKNDTEAAVSALDSAIKYNPQYAEALCLRGIIYTGIRRYKKAARDLKDAREANPKLAEVYSAQGDLDSAQGDYADAVENYRMALDLNENLIAANYGLGTAFLEMRDSKSAYRYFTRACKQKDEQACARAAELSTAAASGGIAQDISEFITKANSQRAAGNFAGAVKILNSALDEAPDSYHAFRLKGDIELDDLNDWKAALTDYSGALRIRPESADTFIKRAQAYKAGERYDDAVKDYNEAILLEPKSASAVAGLGGLYMAKGDYSEALSAFNRAISFDPQNGEYYFMAASVCRKLGQAKSANVYFTKACERGFKTACGFVKK